MSTERSKLGLFEAILKYHAVGGASPQVATEPKATSFEEGLNELIEGCEQSEEIWAKILLIIYFLLNVYLRWWSYEKFVQACPHLFFCERIAFDGSCCSCAFC